MSDAREDRYQEYCEWSVTALADRLVDAEDEVSRLERALRLSEAKIGGAARYVEQADARSAMLENALTAYEGIADERDRFESAWKSARRRAKTAVGAWRYQQRAAEVAREDRQEDGHVIRELVCAVAERSSRLRRYRLAWLAARRRAADEANFGMEALELRDAEIARLRADRATTLRERADFFEGCLRDAADPSSDPRYWAAIRDVAMGLRRLADEAQQPETRESTHAPRLEQAGEVEGETVWRLSESR